MPEEIYVLETKNLMQFLYRLGIANDQTNHVWWMIDDVLESQDLKQYSLSRLFTDVSDKID